MKFLGKTYFENHASGPREIGVVIGLNEKPIVAWFSKNGSMHRVKSKNLDAGIDSLELQRRLDLWANKKGLKD